MGPREALFVKLLGPLVIIIITTTTNTVIRTVDSVVMFTCDTRCTRQSVADDRLIPTTLTQLRTTRTVVVHLNTKHIRVGNQLKLIIIITLHGGPESETT